MLELLNQLDGFDSRADVKVILATNKIESLDPALLRPGRVDRKILFPLPDVKTKRRIFGIHTDRMYVVCRNDMHRACILQALSRLTTCCAFVADAVLCRTLGEDVDLEEFIMSKSELSGADIKAVCSEAGMMALRERRMKVVHADFQKAKENVLYKKKGGAPEGLYL